MLRNRRVGSQEGRAPLVSGVARKLIQILNAEGRAVLDAPSPTDLGIGLVVVFDAEPCPRRGDPAESTKECFRTPLSELLRPGRDRSEAIHGCREQGPAKAGLVEFQPVVAVPPAEEPRVLVDERCRDSIQHACLRSRLTPG